MQISHHIQQIVAPNPGIMTGHGTNCYLITSADNRCIVVDPGPDIKSHIHAIIEAAKGAQNIKAIALTHMHPDHSPAAMPLAKLTGATIYSAYILDDEYQDKTLVPDTVLTHNDLIEVDELTLRAIYTPGHVDNHLCFLLENDQVVMTGDHIMQGSTVVIIPPHGNMKKYLASLALLKEYPIKALAPGHGSVIDTPITEIDGLIAHRLKREAKVRERLAKYDAISLNDLTPDVYDDVQPDLHTWASYSLWSHLLKLEEEGEAECIEDLWRIKK